MTNTSNERTQSVGADWLRATADDVRDEILQDPTLLSSKECRAVYEWWAAFLPSLPTRGSVPLARFAKLLPSIYLSQLIDDERFDVRIQGERVKAMLGANNFPPSFSVHDAGFAGVIAYNYREAIRRRAALRHTGTMRLFNRDHISFESADFPIWGDEGAPPYILGVIVPLNEASLALPS